MDNSPDDVYEASLGTVTNEEWLYAHTALSAVVAQMPEFPDNELSYIWDPSLDPATLIGDGEVDHGPSREDVS